MAIIRINHFEANPGQGPALRRFFESILGTIRSCPGCRSVQLLESVEQAERFAIVETWDGVEAHQAAAGAIPPEKMREAVALFAGPPRGAYFRAADGA